MSPFHWWAGKIVKRRGTFLKTTFRPFLSSIFSPAWPSAADRTCCSNSNWCENVLVKEVIWHIHGLIISHEKVIVVEFLNWKQLFHAHGLLIKWSCCVYFLYIHRVPMIQMEPFGQRIPQLFLESILLSHWCWINVLGNRDILNYEGVNRIPYKGHP